MTDGVGVKKVVGEGLKDCEEDIGVGEDEREERGVDLVEFVVVVEWVGYVVVGGVVLFVGCDFVGYCVVVGLKVVGGNVMWSCDVVADL